MLVARVRGSVGNDKPPRVLVKLPHVVFRLATLVDGLQLAARKPSCHLIGIALGLHGLHKPFLTFVVPTEEKRASSEVPHRGGELPGITAGLH